MSESISLKNVVAEDYWNRLSPIQPYILNSLGTFLSLTMVFGVTLNGLLLIVFKRHKDLHTPLNVLVITISILNFIGCLTQLPWVIHSSFSHRWTSGKLGCDVSSTVMFFIGCTSAHLMAAISFERFYIMYKPLNIRKINFRTSFISVFICCAFGLFWSLMPLVGWSYYTFEDGLISCAVEFKGSSLNVRSFIIAIFIFVYLIPFGFIMGTNILLFIIIKRLPIMNKEIGVDAATKKRVEVQTRITKIMIIYITGFIVSWTPYAIVSFYTGFIDEEAISPLGATMPAFFMKSSMVWSTLFFILTNNNIRPKFFPCLKPKPSETTVQAQTTRTETTKN